MLFPFHGFPRVGLGRSERGAGERFSEEEEEKPSLPNFPCLFRERKEEGAFTLDGPLSCSPPPQFRSHFGSRFVGGEEGEGHKIGKRSPPRKMMGQIPI